MTLNQDDNGSVYPFGTTWPLQVGSLFSTRRAAFNLGIDGQTSAQILARIQTLYGGTNKSVCVMCMGGNDITVDPSPAGQAVVIANVASSVSAVQAAGGNYLVLSLMSTSNISDYYSPNGDYYIAQTNINAALAAAYPNNYIDTKAALISHYNPNISQDVTDIGNGIVPGSLRVVEASAHLTQLPDANNIGGGAIVAGLVQKFITANGW